MYYYDAKTNSFYPEVLKGDYLRAGTWPDDPVAVSDDDYCRLLRGCADGKIIEGDETGKPVLVDPPPETPEQYAARAAEKKLLLTEVSEARIAILSRATRLDMATPDEEAELIRWERYSVQLSRVDTGAADISWPDVPKTTG